MSATSTSVESTSYKSIHLCHSAVAWLKRPSAPDDTHFDLRTPPGFPDTNAICMLNLTPVIDSPSLPISVVFACRQLIPGDLVDLPRDNGGNETLPLADIVRTRLTRERLVGLYLVTATCVCQPKHALVCQRTLDENLVDSIPQKTAQVLRHSADTAHLPEK